MSQHPIEEKTHCAHWGWHEHQYFGYEVFAELLGKESFAGLCAIAVLGRRLPPASVCVLEDVAICVTLADPRIWPLKLTRLVAAYGMRLPAAAAGIMIQEGARIGPWTAAKAAEFLADVHRQLGDQADDLDRVRNVLRPYLASHSFVWGFGTPFRPEDERLVALTRRIQQHGRHQLPHWRTMKAVVHVLHELRQLEPNVSIGIAAAFLDLGLADREVGPMLMALVHHMFLANALESAAHAPASLRLLPNGCIAYKGHAPRMSPRATALAARGLPAAAAAAKSTSG